MGKSASIKYHSPKCLGRQPEFSPIDKSRTLFMIGLTLLIILLVGASIFYISTHIRAVDMGYKINQELQRKHALIEENKLLRLKIGQLKSPTRIEKEAKDQLHLLPPAPHQVVYLSKLDQSELFKTVQPETNPPPAVQPVPKPAKKVAKMKSAPAPKRVSPPTPKIQSKPNKKIILAKIITQPTSPALSPNKTLLKKSVRKNKESLPAVMLDPMP